MFLGMVATSAVLLFLVFLYLNRRVSLSLSTASATVISNSAPNGASLTQNGTDKPLPPEYERGRPRCSEPTCRECWVASGQDERARLDVNRGRHDVERSKLDADRRIMDPDKGRAERSLTRGRMESGMHDSLGRGGRSSPSVRTVQGRSLPASEHPARTQVPLDDRKAIYSKLGG